MDQQTRTELLAHRMAIELLWVVTLKDSADPLGSLAQIKRDSVAALRGSAEGRDEAFGAVTEEIVTHLESLWGSVGQRLLQQR